MTFAQRRRDDLGSMTTAKTFSGDPHLRQQLVQEFFFHLVGAFDLLAQLVNEKRQLGLDSDNVTIRSVIARLAPRDPLTHALEQVHVVPRGAPVPSNPHSDEGLLFRLYNYRHQVTHRRRNPFYFVLSQEQVAYFFIDPRENGDRSVSARPFTEELDAMLRLAKSRCQEALALVSRDVTA
ncbi:MAG: hypothetical protein ACREQV_21565 [Candidatus Binatia bacterium]